MGLAVGGFSTARAPKGRRAGGRPVYLPTSRAQHSQALRAHANASATSHPLRSPSGLPLPGTAQPHPPPDTVSPSAAWGEPPPLPAPAKPPPVAKPPPAPSPPPAPGPPPAPPPASTPPGIQPIESFHSLRRRSIVALLSTRTIDPFEPPSSSTRSTHGIALVNVGHLTVTALGDDGSVIRSS